MNAQVEMNIFCVCVCVCVGMQTGCLGVMLHLKSSCLACNWLVRAHKAAYMLHVPTTPILTQHSLTHTGTYTAAKSVFCVPQLPQDIRPPLLKVCVCIITLFTVCVCVCVVCVCVYLPTQ